MTVKVHFDGKVFVPDEAVDLPAGFVAEVLIERQDAAPPVAADSARPRISALITGLDPELVRAIGQDPEFNLENA
jgi:hypothetical protein